MLNYSKGLILLLNILLVFKAIKAQNYETENGIETNSVDNFDLIDEEHIDEVTYPVDNFEGGIENVPKSFLLSWQARRSLRKILAKMPCGWPEYDIPPLAPYENEDFTFNIENSVLKTETKLNPIRIDGLNNMVINRLKVGLIFKRISFDFNYPNITLTGNFDTSSSLNLEEVIGLPVYAKGSGKFQLGLENLRIAGNLKYKLPIFFGSAKIQKVNAQISLGNAYSEISGFINGLPISDKVNDFIITSALELLNEHDYIWNGLIEKYVLPVVNSQLEGKTLWKIFWWSISRNNENGKNTCDIEDLDQVDIVELHQLLLKNKMPIPKVVNDQGIQN